MRKPIGLADLKAQLNKPEEYNVEFYTNPGNLRLLKEILPKNVKESGEATWLMPTTFHCLYGIPIYVDEHLPQFVQRWKFPRTPFVQYEDSDQVWALPIGFGRYVDTDQPLFIKMNKSVVYGGFNYLKPFKYSSPIYTV